MVFNIVVWGETGDGKSTLINNLCRAPVAPVGKKPGGVTKEIKDYRATLRGYEFTFWDLPGVGDKDVPAYQTLQKLGTVFSSRKVDGLLLLSSRPDRMPLGAQIVAKMMDLSFSNLNKWTSVGLVGTKNDKYDDGDAINFKSEVLREFNRTTGGAIRKVCTINHKDFTAVEDMLVSLAQERGIGTYTSPSAASVSQVVQKLNGVHVDVNSDPGVAHLIAERKRRADEAAEELRRQRAAQYQAQLRHEANLRRIREEQQRRDQQLAAERAAEAERQRAAQAAARRMIAAASSGGGGGGCFPSGEVVVTKEGDKCVEKLRIGDVVQVDGGEWEPVVGFYDYDPTARHVFVEIVHSAGVVRLTGNHLIYAVSAEKDDCAPMQAMSVLPGMMLTTSCGERVQVLATGKSPGVGAFSPATPSGRVIVGRVTCSAYAKPRRFANVAVSDRTAHALLHLGALPLRWAWRARAAVPAWVAAAPEPRPTTGSHWGADALKSVWVPLLRLALPTAL